MEGVQAPFINTTLLEISDNGNHKAYHESRVNDFHSESSSQSAFHKRINFFGESDVDLFTSRVNFKCDKYVVTLQRDPDAWKIALPFQACLYYSLGKLFAFSFFFLLVSIKIIEKNC